MKGLLLQGLILLFSVLPVYASSFNIDFGQRGTPDSSYGAAAGQPGTWNSFDSYTYPGVLLDLDGNPSGASLNLTGWWAYGSGAATDLLGKDQVFSYAYAPGQNLWNLTIEGLQSGIYDLYIYAPSHPSTPTGHFSFDSTLHTSGDTINVVSLHTGIDGVYDDVDYILLQDLFVDAGRTLIMSMTGYGDVTPEFGDPYLAQYAGLAGMQLVSAEVPIPSAAWLLVSGLIGLVGFRKKFQIA